MSDLFVNIKHLLNEVSVDTLKDLKCEVSELIYEREVVQRDRKKFMDTLYKFRDAANELDNMWDECCEDSEFMNITSMDYPFKDSFDEVRSQIFEWVESVNEQVSLLSKE
jgi:hypothetical protein